MMPGGPCPAGTFDRILLDAPCTNTGVLRRRVDVRWRLTGRRLHAPARAATSAMLRRAAELLKPGGSLVYCTCSLEREENEEVVEQALAHCPGCASWKPAARCPFAMQWMARSPRAS